MMLGVRNRLWTSLGARLDRRAHLQLLYNTIYLIELNHICSNCMFTQVAEPMSMCEPDASREHDEYQALITRVHDLECRLCAIEHDTYATAETAEQMSSEKSARDEQVRGLEHQMRSEQSVREEQVRGLQEALNNLSGLEHRMFSLEEARRSLRGGFGKRGFEPGTAMMTARMTASRQNEFDVFGVFSWFSLQPPEPPR